MAEIVISSDPCRDCGLLFEREKKRGRPSVRCSPCLDKLAGATVEVEATGLEEVPDNLYTGDPDLLKGTPGELPKGNSEAQCVVAGGCGRIFTTDSNCESHKEYQKSRTLCLNPANIGMVAIERRGIPVWRKPMDADTAARLANMRAGKAKK